MDNNKKCFFNATSANYTLLLKDHVTLKIGVMVLKILFFFSIITFYQNRKQLLL